MRRSVGFRVEGRGVNWLLRRFREPSTWRGLVWLATVAGLSLRPDQAEAIVTVGMALAGLLGVFLQDETKTELPPIDLQGRPESGHAGPGVDPVQPVDFVRQPVSSQHRADPDTRPNLGGFGDRD
mgnify:CR=1 FL=1